MRSQSSQIEKQPEHKCVSFSVSDRTRMASWRCVDWEGVQKSSGGNVKVYMLIVASIGNMSNGTHRFYYTVSQ